MPSRRTHTNSHHGCFQCKAKKVKCDEKQPSCTRCSKSNKSQCKYNHLAARSGRPRELQLKPFHPQQQPQFLVGSRSFHPRDFVGPFSQPDPCSTISVHLPFDSDIDTKMLHYHYTHVTSKSFSLISGNESQENFQTWDASIRQQAITHEFLYHGMLAFASLHLATLHPDNRTHYITRSLKHQNKALVGFRPELQNISALNCEASLGFSGLLIVSALAFPLAQAAHSTPPVSSLDDLQRLMNLFHGTVELYRMGWMGTLDTNLSPHIRAKVLSAQLQEIPAPEAEASLNILEASKIAGLKDERKKALYRMVISKLVKTSRRSAAHPSVASFVLMWPGMVSAAYIKTLKEHDPISLVLLAHWAVTLHTIRHYWWAKEWGRSTVSIVVANVSSEFQCFLNYPKQQVGLSGSV